MSGRLAVDFGTSNTLIAKWDPEKKEGIPLEIPEFSHVFNQTDGDVPVIPSLIHYTEDGRRWIGEQVIQRGLFHSRRTFRWMKRYISQRSPIRVQLGGQEFTPFRAGRDFLSSILLIAAQQAGEPEEEIALSVPVESFEHYEDWLATVAESAGLPRFRLIDEPSAAALGYGAHIQPGNVYLVFDFGGGTMHAAVVLMEAEENQQSGRRCRMLGKAGKYIGGATIDQWIFSEILQRNNCRDYEERVRKISNSLLVQCEKLKEQLTVQDKSTLQITDASGEMELAAEFSRSEFEALLDQHDLYAEINRTIRSAINGARERGYDEEAIKSVLLVGGSSAIPSVQRTIRQFFGKERVMVHHPLDAVVRGAAAFVAGVDFFDHIQHDYAIRFVNPQTGDYEFRVIIKRGTSYPTRAAVVKLAIKPSYDGQKQLGIAIFELSEARLAQQSEMELVFDPSGAARMVQVTPQEQQDRRLFWMNEHHPTFLSADPPGKQGEPQFEVAFNVDANKRLLVTALDLKSGKLIFQDYPVVKLT